MILPNIWKNKNVPNHQPDWLSDDISPWTQPSAVQAASHHLPQPLQALHGSVAISFDPRLQEVPQPGKNRAKCWEMLLKRDQQFCKWCSVYKYIHIYYRYTYIHYIYIYICSRPAAGQPPPSSTPSNHSTTPWGWPSSYALLTCWPRATYALPNRIPPCAVFTTAYMPIQSIYNILLPIKYLYSSHIRATVKI